MCVHSACFYTNCNTLFFTYQWQFNAHTCLKRMGAYAATVTFVFYNCIMQRYDRQR